MNSNSTTDLTGSLLLEIGTEEIPARFLPPALTQLKELGTEHLSAALIDFGSIQTYAAPRRLTLIVRGVAESARSSCDTVMGPPVKAAFDSEGNHTRAAEGFAKSQGVSVKSLKIEKKGKGEYVAAVIEKRGRPSREVLPEILRKIILSLQFPKSMRWGNSSIRFVRPMHWILAILDSAVLDFEIEGLRSSNKTCGHRFLSPGEAVIENAEVYFEKLGELSVVVDQDIRMARIKNLIDTLAKEAGGVPVSDSKLSEHVNYLVEYPTAVRCSFAEEYLKLPRELLITVMRDHQKYFAVEDNENNLLNTFVVISNTKEKNAEAVRRGAEKVIRARFEDARFYYEDDLKESLEDRVDELKRVTFHDRLGSLHDKTLRVQSIAMALSSLLSADSIKVERAALLSKADLVTGVVREFPELQGLMGRYYALHRGEDSDVAAALHEHYLPSHAGDIIPATETGTILSISDRIDNIVSFFSIGLRPTGSEDPFGLRRQMIGITDILSKKSYGISIEELLDTAISENSIDNVEEVRSEIRLFFHQRLESILTSEDYSHDTIQSIIGRSTWLPLPRIRKIADAVTTFRKEPHYNKTVLALKRVYNILKDSETGEADQDIFQTDEEKYLYSEILRVRREVEDSINIDDYNSTFTSVASLRKAIDTFFDNVLVMDKDESVRQNRFSLLGMIKQLTEGFIEISKLQEIQ